jgi:hypothetical protein
MEFGKVFVTLGVVMIAIIAIMSFISSLNTTYSENLGNTFNNTLNITQRYNTIAGYGQEVGGTAILSNTTAGQENAQAGLITRAVKTIVKIPELFSIIPAMINDLSVAADIPTEYVNIGIAVFFFISALTIATILLLGVNKA